MESIDLQAVNIEEIKNIDDEDIDRAIRAPKRYIRDGENQFEFYDNIEFKRRFKFSKDLFYTEYYPK